MNFNHNMFYSIGKNLQKMAENTRYSGAPVISTRSKQPLKTDYNKPLQIIREKNYYSQSNQDE